MKWPKYVLYVGFIIAQNIIIGNCHSQLWTNQELRHYSSPVTIDKSEPTIEPTDVYLESMEDLEHVAYLTMRNFNLTDESLLQSSWLVGLGNSIVHKQHQKIDPLASSDMRGRLELMLESFIWHLRNGHLKRLHLDDLISIGESLNYTLSSPTSQNEPININGTIESNSTSQSATKANKTDDMMSKSESNTRCYYLVNIYINELKERQQKKEQHQQQQQQQQHQQQQQATVQESNSKIEYEKLSINNDLIDSGRLMNLCKLAVECHTTDDLVNLISGSWRHQPLLMAPPTTPRAKRRRSMESENDAESSGQQQEFTNMKQRRYTKSLRDSLSTSLAKLCPLMLFQLHDDDGLCTMRRDDRPPMITVWGFATLFVTIVSFCSLIGLSITPLLGPTATDTSAGSSEIGDDDLAANTINNKSSKQASFTTTTTTTGINNHTQQQQHHRACLTLFEGLAVGSLVGSALFSLIPQAFELQERESNQGFLLKALIIFFGIYLFFCSERLMRIILDTRQQRKKKKRLQHRSSNLPSTTADLEHHLIPFHSVQHQHQHLQQQQQQNYTTSASGAGKLQNAANRQEHRSSGRRNFGNPVSFSGSSQAMMNQQEGFEVGQVGGMNSVNLRQQHQQPNDQHIDQVKQPIDGPLRSVNFNHTQQQQQQQKKGGRKKKKQQQHQQVSGNESVKHPYRTTTMEQAESNSTLTKHQQQQQNQVRQFQQVRGKGMLDNESQEQQPQQQQQRVVLDGKRRKTRQQLQAAKRRRNRRLVQKLAPQQHRAQQQLTTDEPNSDQLQTSPPPTSCSNVQATETTNSKLTMSKNYYFDYSSSSTCSTYDSNDDLYNSNLSNCADDSNNDDDDAYFIASKRYRRSRQTESEATKRQLLDLESMKEDSMMMQQEQVQRGARCKHFAPPNPNQMTTKQDISTVAWMIVLGDGLHNFIDGISIGAAFSESILSGVSISVAVICEEFPHELGDFAVLVSSGMTVRQALGYNFLSACTCYFGMAVGIILGDVNDGASYISALAAGVFLYIALVDMMGELSATLEETSRDSIAKTLKLLLLQNVGIFIGISIIFILSFIDF